MIRATAEFDKGAFHEFKLCATDTLYGKCPDLAATLRANNILSSLSQKSYVLAVNRTLTAYEQQRVVAGCRSVSWSREYPPVC